jgi:hypothetical protein
MFAPYIGEWRVHSTALTIKPDRTGTEISQYGPCLDPLTHPDCPLCDTRAIVKLQTVVGANGTTASSKGLDQDSELATQVHLGGRRLRTSSAGHHPESERNHART